MTNIFLEIINQINIHIVRNRLLRLLVENLRTKRVWKIEQTQKFYKIEKKLWK